MDYSEFKETIQSMIKDRLGEDFEIRVFEVRKNNGIFLDNLSIRRKEDVISPCIYLQFYYGEYINGRTMDELADEMIDYYRRSLPRHFDLEKFLTDESIRSHLVCRLVNTKRNSVLLDECPHIPYLNLSVIFYLLFDDPEIGAGAIVIRNSNISELHLKEEELPELAFRNMKRLLPADLIAMDDLIRELRSGNPEGEEEGRCGTDGSDLKDGDDLPLYVLTNARRSFGAAWIMDPDVLKDISGKLGDDFYVLPSSVHECMILPAHLQGDPCSLAQMVEEINESQVAPEEILSDNVYVVSA